MALRTTAVHLTEFKFCETDPFATTETNSVTVPLTSHAPEIDIKLPYPPLTRVSSHNQIEKPFLFSYLPG